MNRKFVTAFLFLLFSFGGFSASTKTFTYNLRDQVISIVSDDDPNNPVTFTYDENGNRRTKTQNGVTTEYKWSARGDLREVSRNGIWLARYLYDFQGLRISKQVRPIGKNIQETRYHYDGNHLLYETNVLSNVLVRYHWAQGEPIGETRNGENYYYMLDAMGSVVAVTAQDGSVVARIEYDAFGNITRTHGSHAGLFGFTGFYADDETGLYYAQQRYYDSELGAFISEDPLEGVANDPPTQHRYLYARANPTKYLDKDGRCSSVVNQIDPYACDRHTAGLTDSKILAQNTQDIKNEAAAYAGIGQAVGDVVTGTIQTAKDIGGTYVEAATGGKYARGSMLRLRGQVDATYEFVKHPVKSVQTAINNHKMVVAEMESRGDFEGPIQERARFATTGLLTAIGAGKGGQITYNKGKNFIQSHLPEPPIMATQNSFTGIITEGADNKVHFRSFEDVDVQRNYYQYWTQEPIVFQGNKVFPRDDLFDPDMMTTWKQNNVVHKGTNLERMAAGRAPIDPTGKSVNLHHMTQRHEGSITEVTQRFHSKNKKVIHINPNTIPSGINRAEFNKWREKYWIERAKTYETNNY